MLAFGVLKIGVKLNSYGDGEQVINWYTTYKQNE